MVALMKAYSGDVEVQVNIDKLLSETVQKKPVLYTPIQKLKINFFLFFKMK